MIEHIVYVLVVSRKSNVTFTRHTKSGRVTHKRSCAVPECLMAHTFDTVQLPICTVVRVSSVTGSEKRHKKDDTRALSHNNTVCIALLAIFTFQWSIRNKP